ncbi:alpha/beta fold hydrolase [Tenacibaculum maritimum]|uniref:alpha/beta fold hydrolase n=2 Tax=Tenacibaculum maritimum TaxID=107401 RepID=UPI001E4722B7|nr:alpha/beta hydrolase [Tenacibaculum maritimum]
MKAMMKLIIKICKWIGLFLAGVATLLLVAGICYRLLNSKPIPPGKLVDVNGTKLHIRAEGERNNLPTLVLEAGAGGSTDMFHWIAEGLKAQMRVVCYDREGKGFSESSGERITPEFYARQLHELLERNGEKPPYILVGHSMGGPYHRIFRELFPTEVIGMVFLDASHPEQWKRLAQKELIPKEYINSIRLNSILADVGIVGIYNKMFNSKFRNDGLPKDCHIRSRAINSYSGRGYARYLKENDINDKILFRSGQASDLDSLPVLVFTATEQYSTFQKEKYRREGIDPEAQVKLWLQMQKELKELSTRGKQFIMDASHGTIITEKANADIINKEILLMATSIK